MNMLGLVKRARTAQVERIPGIHGGETDRLHHRSHGELMIHKVPDDRRHKQSDPKPNRHEPPAHQDCNPAHSMILPSGVALGSAIDAADLACEPFHIWTKNSRATALTPSRLRVPLYIMAATAILSAKIEATNHAEIRSTICLFTFIPRASDRIASAQNSSPGSIRRLVRRSRSQQDRLTQILHSRWQHFEVRIGARVGWSRTRREHSGLRPLLTMPQSQVARLRSAG